jgi:hypothetical protein
MGKRGAIRILIMNPRDCFESSFPVADTPIRNYKEATQGVAKRGVPSDYTVQINSVEADWDDESERVEVRVELFLSSNRADVNINQLRYWVTILAQI